MERQTKHGPPPTPILYNPRLTLGAQHPFVSVPLSPIERTHHHNNWHTASSPFVLPPTATSHAQHSLSSTTCHEFLFSQNSFFPKKASFSLFLYGVCLLTTLHRLFIKIYYIQISPIYIYSGMINCSTVRFFV